MKKASLAFAVVPLILVSHSMVIAQTFDWARKSNTTLFATGADVATDEHGNSYVTGTFMGKVNFGEFELGSLGGRDVYLVKYGKDGIVLWAKRLGGTADDFGNAITLDKDGNCYLAGAFGSQLILGSDTLVSKGQHDMFLAKYNSSGDLLWCKSAGGYYEDHAMAISLDKAGNCYLAGYFKDTLWFGGGKMLAGKGISQYIMLLAKYDGKGNLLWTKPIGGSNYATQNEGLAIVSEPSGMTYITGYYQGEATFDAKAVC